MAAAPSPARVTARPLADLGLEAAVAFCQTHRCSPVDEATVRRLMLHLTSGPAARLVLELDGELALIASVADLLTGPCGVMDILGWRADMPQAPLLDHALELAEQCIAAGSREHLDMPVTDRVAPLLDVLERRGYRHAFSGYRMATPEMAPPAPACVPGPDWRWVCTSDDRAADHHAAVRAAFHNLPGSYGTTHEEFRTAVLAAPDRHQLLLHGDRVAAFTHISWPSPRTGEVRMVGRHPDYRAHGLGAQALTRAMQLLAAGGATSFGLDVSATNDAALTLYRRFGFAVTHDEPTWRWSRTPAHRARHIDH